MEKKIIVGNTYVLHRKEKDIVTKKDKLRIYEVVVTGVEEREDFQYISYQPTDPVRNGRFGAVRLYPQPKEYGLQAITPVEKE